MEQRQKQFSIWYFVITLVLLTLLQSVFMAPHVQTLDYSEFKTLLRAGKIFRVTLNAEYVRGQLRTEGLEGLLPEEKVAVLKTATEKPDSPGLHSFITVRVDDPDLVRDLEAARVPYTGKVENTWFSTLLSWVLPIGLFYVVWMFLMRRMAPH